jgi:hypothetical protein
MAARGISFVQLGVTFFVMMSKGEKRAEPSFLGRKEIGTTLLLRIFNASERESINFNKVAQWMNVSFIFYSIKIKFHPFCNLLP